MAEAFEFTGRTESFEGVVIADPTRGRMWDQVLALTKEFVGKRPTNVARMTDSVTAFFGGPTMGQSTWARECHEELVAQFGRELTEENESFLQALKRTYLNSTLVWLVSITEHLLQGWSQGHDEDFNGILAEGAAPIRFVGGRAQVQT